MAVGIYLFIRTYALTNYYLQQETLDECLCLQNACITKYKMFTKCLQNACITKYQQYFVIIIKEGYIIFE